jgi:hypothetical protein
MTTDDELKPLAQRIWPNANEIHVVHDAGAVSTIGIDAHGQVIDQLSADSVDALRTKLEHSLPDGGQAP